MRIALYLKIETNKHQIPDAMDKKTEKEWKESSKPNWNGNWMNKCDEW